MSNNKNTNLPKTKKRLFIFRRTFALILVTIVVIATLVTSMLFTDMKAMIEARPDLNVERLGTMESSRIFDADGNMIAEIGYKLSDNVTFEEMPASLVDAFISIEDSRFFEHQGFDVSRFIAAIIGNLRSGDLFDTGASTLTMQIVKNTFFVTEESLAPNTIERKVQEISMALDLEEDLDKKDILEHYVNKINFGVPNSLGVGKAAEYYFGKEVSELNLSESAYLAGVINSPTTYNVFRNVKAATQRRNEVLNLMQRHGYINSTENKLAQSIRLEDQVVDNELYRGNDYIYPHYIDTVIDEVTDLTGVSPFAVGMDVYTSLIPSQQEAIEAIQNGDVVQFDDDKVQVALVTLNNQTGEIVAIGGGRPDKDKVQRGLNRATSTFRQPGSVLKPVVSYALAFENLGWSTEHIIEDGPYAYAGGDFVNNFSRRFAGDISVTDAVISSLNIPAIKALEEVIGATSYGYVTQYLKNLGFNERTADNFSLGYAIGSAAFSASTLEVAGSHATIINKGVYIKPHTVKRIEITGQEAIIPQYAQSRALSEGGAYLAAYTMNEAVNAPIATGTSATRLKQGYPVYGKTGTTDHDDSFVSIGIPDGAGKDSWISASTSQFTNTIWYGYDRSNEGDYLKNPVAAGNLTAAMANYLLDALEPLYTPTAIERPAGVSNISHIVGVYPYAKPIEGMDSSLIVNGLIKSEFATLREFDAPELEDLQSQTVQGGRLLFGGLKLNVTMTPYPNLEMLEVADDTKEMSATNKDGVVMTRTGRRIFDPSWIFGAVKYATEVKVDGQVVETIVDEKNAREITLSEVRPNQNIEVCSYYRWEKNDDIRSNQVCETTNSGEQSLVFPRFSGLPVEQFEAWIRENSTATYELKMVNANRNQQVGLISKISPDFSNREYVEQSAIDDAKFKIEYFDLEISSNDIIGKPVSEVRRKFRDLLVLSNDLDPNAKIVSFTVAGKTFTSGGDTFLLSQLKPNSYNLPVIVEEVVPPTNNNNNN